MNNIKSFGIILIGMMIVAFCPVHNAMAYDPCSNWGVVTSNPADYLPSNCASAEELSIGGSYYGSSDGPWVSCTSCEQGTLTSHTATTSIYLYGECDVTYYTCECSGCSNCPPSTPVTNTSEHYSGTIYQSCNCNTCEIDNESYVCDDGYQATSWNGDIPTCTAVPTCGNLCGGYSSTYDSGSQKCCINESGSDAKGSYTISHCE